MENGRWWGNEGWKERVCEAISDLGDCVSSSNELESSKYYLTSSAMRMNCKCVEVCCIPTGGQVWEQREGKMGRQKGVPQRED